MITDSIEETLKHLFRYAIDLMERNDTRYGIVSYQGTDFLVGGWGKRKKVRTVQVSEVRQGKGNFYPFFQLLAYGERVERYDICEYDAELSETGVEIKNGLYNLFDSIPNYGIMARA